MGNYKFRTTNTFTKDEYALQLSEGDSIFRLYTSNSNGNNTDSTMERWPQNADYLIPSGYKARLIYFTTAITGHTSHRLTYGPNLNSQTGATDYYVPTGTLDNLAGSTLKWFFCDWVDAGNYFHYKTVDASLHTIDCLCQEALA